MGHDKRATGIRQNGRYRNLQTPPRHQSDRGTVWVRVLRYSGHPPGERRRLGSGDHQIHGGSRFPRL